jgi:hypothetical protein
MEQHDEVLVYQTWQMQGEPIECDADTFCIRYSPSGELLAIDIQIYNPDTMARAEDWVHAFYGR